MVNATGGENPPDLSFFFFPYLSPASGPAGPPPPPAGRKYNTGRGFQGTMAEDESGGGGSEGTFTVHPLAHHPLESNIYLVRAKRNILVDTGLGMSVDRVMAQISGELGVEAIDDIVLTHKHVDHSGGARALKEASGARLLISEVESDAVRRGDAAQTGADMFGVPQEPAEVQTLAEGDEVDLGGGDALKVLWTPGHSEGSICLWHGSTGTLLSGDTVFTNGGVGRWDLPGGSLGDLRASLRRLAEMDVRDIYPGHMSWSRGDGGDHVQLGLMSLSMY